MTAQDGGWEGDRTAEQTVSSIVSRNKAPTSGSQSVS